MNKEKLVPEEEPILIRLLQKLANSWPSSRPVFEAYVSSGATPAVETVCVRRAPTGWEVFLAKRPSLTENPTEHYPEQWHSPGTVILKDETLDAAFRRIEGKELAPARFSGEPQLVKNVVVHDKRGTFVCLVYRAEIEGVPAKGEFFSALALPQNLVSTHRTIIPAGLTGLTQISH